MRFGLDYSWDRVSPAAHKAAGSTFAVRYLSRVHPDKNLTATELAELHTGGIDVVLVWEDRPREAAKQGRARGATDGRDAKRMAEAVGLGARPIYFTIDYDAPASDAPAILEYFRGVASIIGHDRTGVYGGYWQVKRLWDTGAVAWIWQTYAWSGTPPQWHEAAHIRQWKNGQKVAGATVDFDHAMKDEFGQHDVQPKPPYEGPRGDFAAEVQVNFSNGHWRVAGLPGHVKVAGPDRWASAKLAVTVGPDGIEWLRVAPMPWNAKPLGD